MNEKKLDEDLKKIIKGRAVEVKKVLDRLRIKCDKKTAWAIADLESQTRHITHLENDVPMFAKAHHVPWWKFYAFFAYTYGKFDGTQLKQPNLSMEELLAKVRDLWKEPPTNWVIDPKEPTLPS